MKILYLEPRMDVGQKITSELKAGGYAVLLALNASEAKQLLQLHGRSIDLAIIHREGPYGTGDPGIRFISTLKGDAQHTDLPFVITTTAWTDADCAAHQETPSGANAYVTEAKDASTAKALLQTIRSVTQEKGPEASPAAPPSEAPQTSQIILQDAVPLFTKKEAHKTGTHSIHLEVPHEEQVPVTGESDSQPSLDPIDIQVDLDPTRAGSLAPTNPTASEPAFEGASPSQESNSLALAMATEMPYLFGDAPKPMAAPPVFSPRGDAIIPGGASQSPDNETLKKYLELREQDVSALSTQISALKDQLSQSQAQLREQQARNRQLQVDCDTQRKQVEGLAADQHEAQGAAQAEIENLKFQLKAKADKARIFEAKIQEAQNEIEAIRERVRSDIRKIRVREKELENKLEVVKKDSELLLGSRENKIIELKRRLDIAEYNLDLLQERYLREKERAEAYKSKLGKASQAMKLAEGMLDEGVGT